MTKILLAIGAVVAFVLGMSAGGAYQSLKERAAESESRLISLEIDRSSREIEIESATEQLKSLRERLIELENSSGPCKCCKCEACQCDAIEREKARSK